jgi:flagella basal body P-ring formation protein FlgA
VYRLVPLALERQIIGDLAGMPIALPLSMKYLHWMTHPALAALALVCACSLARADSSAADGITSLDALRSNAVSAIESRARALGRTVDISVSELDPRLRLSLCTRPLETFIPGDGEIHEYTSVAIRCSGAVRWTIYVRAAVSAEVNVLTARGTLPRGAELTLADFDTVRRSVPGSGADYATDYSALKGMRLRQPLSAGEPLTRGKLEVSSVIRRGQKVTLLARESGIEIRVAAIALADGRPAERIQVQNENSRQVVEAVVRDATLVEIGL